MDMAVHKLRFIQNCYGITFSRGAYLRVLRFTILSDMILPKGGQLKEDYKVSSISTD